MTTQENLVDQFDNETEKSSVISVVKGMISLKKISAVTIGLQYTMLPSLFRRRQ